MPAPRSTIVDEAVTPWYHCISRFVRRAFLCGQGYEYRKEWIENRLKELVGMFAAELAGFAVMDNHLHLLVRLDEGSRVDGGRGGAALAQRLPASNDHRPRGEGRP